MSVDLLPDTQSLKDTRQIAIDRVGIKDVTYPMTYVNASGEKVPTVGKFTMVVNLDIQTKGTHMSRFIEVLENDARELDLDAFHQMVRKVGAVLQSDRAEIELSFDFFKKKKAPVSGVESLLDYQVNWTGKLKAGNMLTSIEVVVPVTSLCPCSKSVSKYGAHNQRSHITIRVELLPDGIVSIEDLIEIAEQNASSQLYAILKRDDEKFITEQAYDNPAFVEDLVRNIAIQVNKLEGISYYLVASENFESIHNHSAYAVIEQHKLNS